MYGQLVNLQDDAAFKKQVCSGPDAAKFTVWCGTETFAQYVCNGPQASTFEQWCKEQTGGNTPVDPTPADDTPADGTILIL